ncbi:MAG: hypothetical protein LBP67_03240 [Bacteroidales bacterium]|jgi:hypothetical protein|nr:hypothetical protein [Bacteroidales bacterium]
MANTFKKKEAAVKKKNETPKRKSNKKVENNILLNSLRQFISGDYLFSNNLWRSPLWFILYIVVLILFIVGLRLVPVRKYNEINVLREELKEITVKHHQTKARISLMTTPEVLLKEFVKNNDIAYSEILADPTVIKIIENNGKSK